jgi:hypothetical protein
MVKTVSGPIERGSASTDVTADPEGFAGCPTCHLLDGTMTNATLATGGAWRCRRCGQLWDKGRIAIVVAHNAWESARWSRR